MQFNPNDTEALKMFLEKRVKEIDSEKSFLHSILDVWLNKIDSSYSSSNRRRQKKTELIDLGKFICCFNTGISILEAFCESPDFLVSFNNHNIGIEHTSLIIRDDEKEREGILNKIFRQIEVELRKEPKDYKGLYNIRLVEDIAFSNENQLAIKAEITGLIKGTIDSPNLIKIRRMPHTDIHISHSKASVVGSLGRAVIEEKIKKKEGKIAQYSSDRFNQIWLLLVISGAQTSDDYSYIEEDVFTLPFLTGFNRIFILNFFKCNVMELKTTPII